MKTQSQLRLGTTFFSLVLRPGQALACLFYPVKTAFSSPLSRNYLYNSTQQFQFVEIRVKSLAAP